MSWLSDIKQKFLDDEGFFQRGKIAPLQKLGQNVRQTFQPKPTTPQFTSQLPNLSIGQNTPEFPTLQPPKPTFKTEAANKLNARLNEIKNFGASLPKVEPEVTKTTIWDKPLGKGLVKAQEALNNQIDIQKRDFNDYFWNPIKENPVLKPTAERFEAAVPAVVRQVNPFRDKTDIKQNWNDSKKIGAAALTAYGLAKAPISAILGGAVMAPAIKLGSNIAENKRGEKFNQQLGQTGQSKVGIPDFAQPKPYQKKPITEGVGEAVLQGAGMGLANSGTTRLTNSLVQNLSGLVPILRPLTEQSIQAGMPQVTDTLKQGVSKFLNTAGKRLIKAAVVETAVESPIWATFTQTEQENYLEALTREAEENLVMNIGMAGVQSLGDIKSLSPLVTKSVRDAVFNPDGSLKMRSGKTNLLTAVGPDGKQPSIPEVGIKKSYKMTTKSPNYLSVGESTYMGVDSIDYKDINKLDKSKFVVENSPAYLGGKVITRVATPQETLISNLPKNFQNVVENIKDKKASKKYFMSEWNRQINSPDIAVRDNIQPMEFYLKKTLKITPEQFYDKYISQSQPSIPEVKGKTVLENFYDMERASDMEPFSLDKINPGRIKDAEIKGDLIKVWRSGPIKNKDFVGLSPDEIYQYTGKKTGLVSKWVNKNDLQTNGLQIAYRPQPTIPVTKPRLPIVSPEEIPPTVKIGPEGVKVPTPPEIVNPRASSEVVEPKINTKKTIKEVLSPEQQKIGEENQKTVNNLLTGNPPETLSPEGTLPKIPKPVKVEEILPDEKGILKKVTNSLLGDKSIEGSLGVIKNDSESGEKIYNIVRQSQKEADLLSGKSQDDFRKNLENLTAREKETFSDAVEGKIKVLSKNQQFAIDTWNRIAKEIRDRAVAEGIPVGKIENYFPHFVEQNGAKVINERFMFDRNTDKNYANLVKKREANAPYLKNPEVIFDYISNAYQNISRQKNFGKGDSLLYKLADKTNNPSQIKTYLDQILEKNQPKGVFNRVVNSAQEYQTITKLNLPTSLTNLTQNLSTAMRTGYGNTVKAIKATISNPEVALSRAVRSGQISPDMEKTFEDYTGSGTVASKWIWLIGMNSSEKVNRIIAVNSGYSFAQDLAKKALKGSKSAIRELSRFGFSLDDIKKGLTEDQLISAGRQVSLETQFSTKAGELPYSWKTTAGKLMTQFKSFSYKHTKFLKDNLGRITGEATKGNFAPLASALVTFGVTAPIVGEVINDIKSVFKNKKRDDKGIERYVNNILGATSLGLLDSLPGLTGQYGEKGIISAVGGPTAGDIANIFQATSDLSSGITNYNPKKTFLENIDPNKTTRRNFLKSIPLIGPTMANTFVPNSYIENYLGVNNGLNESDKKTYDNLVKSGNIEKAEAFKEKNQASEKNKKTNIISALLNKNKTEVKPLPTNPTPQEIKDFNKEIDNIIDEGGIPTDEQIKLRFFRNQPKDVKTNTKVYTIVKDIYDNPELSDEYKKAVLKNSGLDEDEFNYYQNASLDNSERQQILVTLASSEDRQQVVNSLIQSKKIVGGKALATSTDIDYLYDQGLISKDEKALINSWKYDESKGDFYQDRDYKGSGSGTGYTAYKKLQDALWKLQQQDSASSRKLSKSIKELLAQKPNSQAVKTIGSLLKNDKLFTTQNSLNSSTIKRVKRVIEQYA